MYDIVLSKNEDFQLNLTWQDENESAYDITGAQVQMQIRDCQGGSTVYASLDSAASNATGSIAVGTTDGQIDITINKTAIDDFDFVEAQYDVIISLDSTLTRLASGNVTVNDGVTVWT